MHRLGRQSTLARVVILVAISIIAMGSISHREIVTSLIGQMSLAEKVSIVTGSSKGGFIGYTPAIGHAGVPEFALVDGPVGVRRGTSTAFPASIALAASWDTDLARSVGAAIGEEARAKGQHVLLGPCINILRVPQGGRSFEGYGEDPYLVGRIASSFIKGVQSQKVIACAKHFAVNNQETERNNISAEVSERALREIYLPAFETAVTSGGVLSVMAAYNKLNGSYCSENTWLLNQVLKTEWGFEGFVVSDWGATHSTIGSALGGMDMEMPTGAYWGNRLTKAVNEGKVPIDVLEDKVTRILEARIALDQMDGAWAVGAKVDTQEHRDIALKAAQGSIVLLKNDGLLPLNKLKKLAVIGTPAAELRYCGGGSAFVNPPYVINPLSAIRERARKLGIDVEYVRGSADDSLQVIPKQYLSGLKAEFFAGLSISGKPILVRNDANIDFDWKSGSPDKSISSDRFSVRWTGQLTPAVSGQYGLGLTSDDGIRLWVDGKLLIDAWSDHASQTDTATMRLEAGRKYSFKVEYYENSGLAEAKLLWSTPDRLKQTEAIAAAKSADVAIVFVGTSSQVESEGFDRRDLSLPNMQDALIQAVAATNPNTVVVMQTGSAVTMSTWADRVQSIAQIWFGGQEGGKAVAGMLFGDFSPSGRLPLTFPKRWEDCPAYGNFPGSKGKVIYDEDIFVGYRHFDTKHIEPLFPFGHGLSFTRFSYKDLRITKVDGGPSNEGKLRVSLKLKNVGEMPGAEVIQVYVKDIESSVERPDRELKAFKKIFLAPGEVKEVSLELDRRSFCFWDAKSNNWKLEPGTYRILVGGSSRDIREQADIDL